jgi:hypothetical protein
MWQDADARIPVDSTPAPRLCQSSSICLLCHRNLQWPALSLLAPMLQSVRSWCARPRVCSCSTTCLSQAAAPTSALSCRRRNLPSMRLQTLRFSSHALALYAPVYLRLHLDMPVCILRSAPAACSWAAAYEGQGCPASGAPACMLMRTVRRPLHMPDAPCVASQGAQLLQTHDCCALQTCFPCSTLFSAGAHAMPQSAVAVFVGYMWSSWKA